MTGEFAIMLVAFTMAMVGVYILLRSIFKRMLQQEVIDIEMNRQSLTGHRRDYYKELARMKGEKLNKANLYSIGFVYLKPSWTNVFDANEKYDSIEQIKDAYEKIFDASEIVEYEVAVEEFRIWFQVNPVKRDLTSIFYLNDSGEIESKIT